MEYVISLTKNKNSHDGSILGKVHDFQNEMKQHEFAGLNVYKKNPLLSACDREVLVYNRHIRQEIKALMFGSNSYLGATYLPHVIKKAIEVTQKFGIGSGGVPLLTGTTVYQVELEKIISETTGFDDAILFSSGYTANLGVISGLIRPDNIIIHDKLDHASLLDRTVMSGAKMLRYKHKDIKSLERLLAENSSTYLNKILVVTDGVFSMDGDIADIPGILEVTRKYGALLLIDEAHATGTVGAKGAGTLSYFGISEHNDIIVTGTLSKAIGTVGGYITASQEIIDYLRIYARSNMFSTSLPPSVCAAAIEVFKEMRETDLVEKLQKNASYLRCRLREEGFNIMQTETPIIPIIVGDQKVLTQMSIDSLNAGIIINPIFPPAVPANLTRFRISVMASHTKEDMDKLIDIIIKMFNKYGIHRFVK